MSKKDGKTYVVVINPGMYDEREYEDFGYYDEAACCRDRLDAGGECVDIMLRLDNGLLTTEL